MKILLFLISCIWLQMSNAEVNQYTIKPGDILDVSVWNEASLQRELHVLPDGTISFPLTGVTNVAGKTIDGIREELTKKLTKYINDPVVSVSVKSADSNVVYVIGQVKTPGRFIMTQPMDVMQVLSLAGGLTTFAKANNIVILRRNSASSEAISFRYGDLEEGKELEKNHLLKSGDVIVVP